MDKSLENLEYCDVYCEDKPNCLTINDNCEAIINIYNIVPAEVKNGRSLRDRLVLLKQAKMTEVGLTILSLIIIIIISSFNNIFIGGRINSTRK